MDRDNFEVPFSISYLVYKAIEGHLIEYEKKVLETLSVLADSLLRHERELSHFTFHVRCECKDK